MPDLALLEQEIRELRAELLNQWSWNHAEHCGQEDGHPVGRCYWPKPDILTAPAENSTAPDRAIVAADA